MNVWLLIIYTLGQPGYMGILPSYDACVQTARTVYPGIRVTCSPRTVEIDPITGKIYYLASDHP
jgi:hypothetical protein